MIQLLLLILKIAGILLLAAAGLALTAILLVLFVPVRYRAEGSRYGAWCARGRVSWLFSALQLEASFENGEAEAALKILGRTVGGGSEDGEDLAEDLKDLETAELERPASREERTSKPPKKPREKTGERIRTPEPPVHTASLRREEGKPGKAGGMLSRVRGRLRRIREGIRRNGPDPADAVSILSAVGGLDLAALAGAFLGGAAYRVPMVIDGFISAAAAALAVLLDGRCRAYLLASHVSAEPAAGRLMEYLGLAPAVRAGLHLGEGTGALTLFPLLDMALAVYHEMDTFSGMEIEAYRPL